MNKYITEFIGTFFWVLTAVLSANNGSDTMAPLAVGAVLMAMVYAGSHISGGHYNPAVTLAMLMRGKVDRSDAIYYIVVQVLGGLVAAMMAVFLLNCQVRVDIRPIQHDVLCSLLAEFLGTFALVYVVLNVTTVRSDGGHSHYGLAIGFALAAMGFALGGISGGAFNPAVALGISVAGMTAWSELWIYLAGTLLGAAAAATVFGLVSGGQDG
jgi:aquaporin Z